jgi:GTPase
MFCVTILGRPNVGKSTLFNALSGQNRSLVEDQPGVTRDRVFAYGELPDESEYLLVDTGGFETPDMGLQPFKDPLVWEQTLLAIEQAHVLVVVFDGRAGVCTHDAHLVKIAKESAKPTLFVVNKLDNPNQRGDEFYELGISSFLAISASHRLGVFELKEAMLALKEELNIHTGQNKALPSSQVALIGRPNAGKSSFLNRLCGENRAIVSPVPGTTRDSIDMRIVFNQHSYVFVDTAGIRKKAKVKERIETLSVTRSLFVIRKADFVVLMIDATLGFEDQDAKLSELCVNEGKPLLICINKWDLVEDKDTMTSKRWEDAIRAKITSHAYVAIEFVSCLSGQRVHKILSKIESMRQKQMQRSPTARINEVLGQLVANHTPALIRKHNKRVKFFYATQVSTRPPTIVIKCNVADEIQESYKRYLSKGFREALGMENLPLRLIFRGKADDNMGSPTH